MPSFGFIKDAAPALKRFLIAREKHTASAEHMNKLAEAAMLEQQEQAEREAERTRSKRPRLVSSKG
jgi:hypothetical protein